jgi:SAM-dependent methyltransferase
MNTWQRSPVQICTARRIHAQSTRWRGGSKLAWMTNRDPSLAQQTPMNADGLRALATRLNGAATAAAALGAALGADLAQTDPRVRPHLAAVLGELGVDEAIAALGPAERTALLGEIRTFALLNVQLLAMSGAGWMHTQSELLESAGDVSLTFAHALKSSIATKLEGLEQSLQAPGSAFLDVGSGVARLAIEMARTWPRLRVVGIEPWQPALALARQNVRAAGLDERIELRQQRGEELTDAASFELAWLPSLFVPEEAIIPVLERVFHALVPRGWLLVATLQPSDDPLVAALARLRTALFGGFVTTAERACALLSERGFAEVRRLASAPSSATALVAGRRPSA